MEQIGLAHGMGLTEEGALEPGEDDDRTVRDPVAGPRRGRDRDQRRDPIG